jgi:mannose-1-phosphate guanylyltransferase
VVRDTAGAIGLAASVLSKFDRTANMVVVTADHILEPSESIQNAIRQALSFIHENPKASVHFRHQTDLSGDGTGICSFW